MRRKEKEIADRAEMESIIQRSRVCRLGLSDGNEPYIVPLCFGFKDDRLYFHSAREGKKIEILKKNDRVCFEFEADVELVPGPEACGFGMKFRSVMGNGRASLIDDPGKKREAMNVIMAHYAEDPNAPFQYKKHVLDKILIIQVEIHHITGKRSGYEGG